MRAGALHVCLADDAQAGEVEQYVRRHPAAGLYHTQDWQQALAAAGFGKPINLIALLGNAIAGVLPVVEYPPARGPRRMLSLPGTPAGGILADEPTVRWVLARRAGHWAQMRTHAALRIREFARPGSRHAAAWDDTPLDWVRLPARAMIGLAGTSREDRAERVERRRFTAEDAHAFWRSGNDASLRLLRALVRSPGLNLQTAYACTGSVRRALGVWTVMRQCVHILAFGRRTPRSDQLRLLELAGRDGLEQTADTIDFPCPPRPHPTLLRLLSGANVEFARERRVDPILQPLPGHSLH
jgi:hypothetical protein